mgnify:CR=1 FL=1
MKVNIDESWKKHLNEEFDKAYFKDLVEFVKNEYQNHTCYPKGKDIFAAFDHCKFDELKVVIIGQDPYHGVDQANGLCFSVKDHIAMPPSLINIFKEIEQDLGKPFPKTGNLERWAKQGVLLLVAEDYKGAIKALNNALARGTEDAGKVHFSLMEANFYAGNFKQAYEHVKEAKKDSSMRRNANAWEPYIKQKAKNRGINI